MSMKPFSYFPGKNQNPDRIVIADREYTLSQFGELANGIDARDRRSCFSTREKKVLTMSFSLGIPTWLP